MPVYGLIGYPLAHSFSPGYFAKKFEQLGLTDHVYKAFPMQDLAEFPQWIDSHPEVNGLNVTIPHKTGIVRYLDDLAMDAHEIGAVNTICFADGKLIGHNTDWIGFRKTLIPLLQETKPERALILGTGGSARAVAYALRTLGIPYMFVSRHPGTGIITWRELTPDHIAASHLIVNTTPLGMGPDTENYPQIHYAALGKGHLLYDLVYNPEETRFLNKGRQQGARTMTGTSMLHAQAEASWLLWQDKSPDGEMPAREI